MSSHHTSGPCHRCGRSGHLARECSLHICFRCNGKGHMAWECVEGVTCSRCGERGHLQRNCKNVSCHKVREPRWILSKPPVRGGTRRGINRQCGRKGHISKFCNDPFVKAAEVERNERHQAILKSRIAFGEGSEKDGFGSLARDVSSSSGGQKATPGPWDGLGDLGQDRTITETQASGVGGAVAKTGKHKSQGGMIGNVKVLTVKRKIYPEGEMDGAKRRILRNCGEPETDICGNPRQTAPRKDTLKVDEPPQWNGLLEYGSEDSRDDSHVSSDEECGEQICKIREHVQLKSKLHVCETNSSDIKPRADERNGSANGLQSSVEREPTSVDERYDSANGIQTGVDIESMIGARPNSPYQANVVHVSQQAIHLKSGGT